jgi:hypothetical protein
MQQTSNVRYICVFDTAIIIDKLVINNAHHYGADTDWGINACVINISTDAITDTTYGAAISNSTELFDGNVTEHTNADAQEDETLWEGDDAYGDGDFDTPLAETDAEGTVHPAGGGDYSVPLNELDASGDVAPGGDGDFDVPLAVMTAAGTVEENEGTASFGLSLNTITAAGYLPVTGDAEFYPQYEIESEAYVMPYATGSFTLKNIRYEGGNSGAIGDYNLKTQVTGSGQVSKVGTGNYSLKISAVSAEGMVYPLITGTGEYGWQLPSYYGAGNIAVSDTIDYDRMPCDFEEGELSPGSSSETLVYYTRGRNCSA